MTDRSPRRPDPDARSSGTTRAGEGQSAAAPRVPRLLIAGTHSGVGKTSATLGLIGAFRRLGLEVAPFKVGPDFIDPAFLGRAAGRAARNLDGWLLPPGELLRTLQVGARGADLALVEGMMGLYDGRSAT